jgi:hypothetical protein
MVPLSVMSSGRVDIAFAVPSEWEEVLRYADASLAGLVTELAQRGVAVPEPGVEVGPDESVWQVELAWPAAKVAVVIDDEPGREACWPMTAGVITNAQQATEVESLADNLSDQIGGDQ